MKPANTFISVVWRQRLPLLGAVVLLALLLGQNLRHMGVDNAIDIWFLQDDPALIDYREFQRRYGQDEVIVIAVRGDSDLRTSESRVRLRELRDLVAGVDGIVTVHDNFEARLVEAHQAERQSRKEGRQTNQNGHKDDRNETG